MAIALKGGDYAYRLIAVDFGESTALEEDECFVCGDGFVDESEFSGIVVNNNYQLLGAVCPSCLRLDVERIRQLLQEQEHLPIGIRLERIDKPSWSAMEYARQLYPGADMLVRLQQDDSEWAYYLDDSSTCNFAGGSIYYAWFSPPITVADQELREASRWKPEEPQ